MKIGVDAGTLSISDDRLKVGVYQVVLHLLEELSRLDAKNQYKLYSFAPIDREVMSRFGPNMENVVITPTKGWFRLRLPLELKLHPVDIFLGLSQAIPRSASYNIGFLYDLGFLHAPEAYPGSAKTLADQTKQLVRRADHIVTISGACRDDIRTTYGVIDNITVAYPGVDSRFGPRGKRSKDERPYFLFTGALKPGKNIPTLLRAFSLFLTHSKKPFDLYLVGGDYWKDSGIDPMIGVLRLGERVRLLGHVPADDLPLLYRGATAFVSPSLWEGFCLPAAEAMASGCLVIGATTGAFPEVVGSAGVLVDPDNVQELAEAMKLVAADKGLRSALIAKGLKKSKVFSWNKFARSVYEIFLPQPART